MRSNIITGIIVALICAVCHLLYEYRRLQSFADMYREHASNAYKAVGTCWEQQGKWEEYQQKVRQGDPS